MYEECLMRIVVIGLENERLHRRAHKLRFEKQEHSKLLSTYKKKFEGISTEMESNIELKDEIRRLQSELASEKQINSDKNSEISKMMARLASLECEQDAREKAEKELITFKSKVTNLELKLKDSNDERKGLREATRRIKEEER